MKHSLKSTSSSTTQVVSVKDNINPANYADPDGRHFLITNDKEAQLAQKRLRRKEGYEEIKQNISKIAGRKNLNLDEANWKNSDSLSNSEKNIAKSEKKS